MKFFAIGPKGGSVSFVDDETGEVRLEIPLQPGVHPVSRFVRLRRAGERMIPSGREVATVGVQSVHRSAGHYDSAANPHFKVSAAQRQVREMMRMMGRTEALARRTAKAQQAMARAQSVAQLPAPAPVGDAPESPAT